MRFTQPHSVLVEHFALGSRRRRPALALGGFRHAAHGLEGCGTTNAHPGWIPIIFERCAKGTLVVFRGGKTEESHIKSQLQMAERSGVGAPLIPSERPARFIDLGHGDGRTARRPVEQVFGVLLGPIIVGTGAELADRLAACD